MAKKKKNKKNQAQEPFSPKKYIKERVRSLTIGDCYKPADFDKNGEGIFVISRKHTGGKVSFACFLVDKWCTGVKDTYCKLRMEETDYEEYLERFSEHCEPCTYEEAHNWIYGAIEFAKGAGIPPHKDFMYTKYFLEEDTDDIPLIEYEYGYNGKYHLVCQTQLEASYYLSFMKKNLSEDEYYYTFGMDEYDDDFDFDESDDESDDDDYDDYDEVEEEVEEEAEDEEDKK